MFTIGEYINEIPENRGVGAIRGSLRVSVPDFSHRRRGGRSGAKVERDWLFWYAHRRGPFPIRMLSRIFGMSRAGIGRQIGDVDRSYRAWRGGIDKLMDGMKNQIVLNIPTPLMIRSEDPERAVIRVQVFAADGRKISEFAADPGLDGWIVVQPAPSAEGVS